MDHSELDIDQLIESFEKLSIYLFILCSSSIWSIASKISFGDSDETFSAIVMFNIKEDSLNVYINNPTINNLENLELEETNGEAWKNDDNNIITLQLKDFENRYVDDYFRGLTDEDKKNNFHESLWNSVENYIQKEELPDFKTNDIDTLLRLPVAHLHPFMKTQFLTRQPDLSVPSM